MIKINTNIVQPRFVLRLRGITAFGYRTDNQGFMVLQQSESPLNTLPSIPRWVLDLRNQLLHSNILTLENNKYLFSKDYEFNSPSAAASVVAAASRNGRTDWMTETGVTLRDFEQSRGDFTP